MEKKKVVDDSDSSLTMERQLSELFCEPSGEFKKFTRMSLEDFENLLNKVSPMIAKQDTRLRKAIPPRVRLAITLRFLASGDSFESLHYLFKISPQLISKIVPEVCLALNEVLKEEIKGRFYNRSITPYSRNSLSRSL
ncbi:hypothetical protein NQ315_009048 [Exocentrus adspersus]|uniref:Protein ANTAGONIST OF LIKE HETEROCHROMATIN PROTEIN 1-like n=1 Tax=Exocentrus adspersus TaxID=1586481 RepID=A0AAV8VD67_9CUCU|nr:hypothetical protein NQ315_009048 [Exocentrus adspersus]